MASGAHGNPEDLKRFAKQLRSTSESVSSLGKNLKKSLSGIDWNDSVKVKIDSDVSAAVSGMEKFARKLDEHAKQVDRKAAELQRYLSSGGR